MFEKGASSIDTIDRQRELVNQLRAPTLLLQSDPRLVVTANQAACAMFGKKRSQIESSRGGQVFDCIHSFTEAGCGKDLNCENCPIKNAIVDTFESGNSHNGVQAVLEVKKQVQPVLYNVQVSTRKTGNFVLVTMDTYSER